MRNYDGVFIDGVWQSCEATIAVQDKYTHEQVGAVGRPSLETVGRAVDSAAAAATGGSLPVQERRRILEGAATLLKERLPDLIELHTAETGFTLSDSKADCLRAVRSLELCAEEAARISGEVVPLDWYPNSAGVRSHTSFEPIGVVCAITPFNSPLNTVIHKVGPALAAGNTVVLKPAEPSPLSAAAVCEIFAEAGLPPGHLNVVFGGPDVGNALLSDSRFGFYAFTGSTAVGRHIAQTIGMRRCQLELGSNAATIVCADADLDGALPRIAHAAFRKAGQVCTSVQRLLVHESVHDGAVDRMASLAEKMLAGDPRDPTVAVGPMISIEAADRAWSRVQQAVDGGARLLAGARREGGVVAPTVLADVDPSMATAAEEIFAPVVNIMKFGGIEEAVAMANATPFGLAAGVYTDSIEVADFASRNLAVGTVQINAPSSNRFDSMPFGGMKQSGFGKEGPRYAIRAMSNEKLTIYN